MYLSKPIILGTLYKCTAILNPRVIKLFNGQCQKLLNLNTISLSKLPLKTLSTDSSQVLKSAENPKEIELAPLPPELEELAKNDPEIGKAIRMILMEHEMHKLTDKRMPTSITVDNMRELLEKKTYMSRKKFLNFLFLKEILPIAEKEKKEKKRLQREKKKEERLKQIDGHIDYGLNGNNIFPHIRDSSMNRFYIYRQAYALMYGQPIVFDLGFQDNMNKRESINMVDQLTLAYHENKIHNEPYNIYFTNVNFQSPMYSQLRYSMPQIETSNNMITLSEKSYLEIFPKKNLVYLTPDAPRTLETYDHNAIYIIGGIVDKSEELPLTMAKAKREGIQMAKLPLRNHLMWGSSGSKCLTLNQMIKIMLDIKYTEDWKKAFEAVPRRKLKSIEEVRELESTKQERLRKRVKQLEGRDKKKSNQEFWKGKF